MALLLGKQWKAGPVRFVGRFGKIPDLSVNCLILPFVISSVHHWKNSTVGLFACIYESLLVGAVAIALMICATSKSKQTDLNPQNNKWF